MSHVAAGAAGACVIIDGLGILRGPGKHRAAGLTSRRGAGDFARLLPESTLAFAAVSITVHHLDLSRSLRVLWLLEELGLEYTLRQWKRDAGFRAPAEATSVHPLGRFPMVEVDGRVLAESGAILEYFSEREGKLRPRDDDALLQYRFFLHYAEGSAMPPLLVQLILNRMRSAPMPFFVKPIARGIAGRIEQSYSGPAIDLHFGFIEGTLAQRPYFAGDKFTLADIQMYYPVEASTARGAGERPHTQAWLKRVTDREAFRRALDKGGPAIPHA